MIHYLQIQYRVSLVNVKYDFRATGNESYQLTSPTNSPKSKKKNEVNSSHKSFLLV